MNRLFMGLLAISALALIVSQAIAGASGTADAADAADNGGVMIIETYSAWATPGLKWRRLILLPRSRFWWKRMCWCRKPKTMTRFKYAI